MTHAVPPSSFTTGMMDVEEHSFTWTIENFSVIRKFKSMIEAQKIYFYTGSKVGRPSKWMVYFQESTIDGKKWIGIFFKVEEPSVSDPSWKNALAEMEFVMEGAVPFNRDTGPLEVASFTTGWGYQQVIPAESTQERLVIKHTFKLSVPSTPNEACQPTLEELQVKFETQARKELFALLLKDPNPEKKIKIISSDKKEFLVKMGILEAQSSVLEAMMKTDMLDANSGVIHFPDISSRGLHVILTFLSTGELHPDWSETRVIVELTNAAGKYQLQDLLKFLDATLGKICTMENVLALFGLADDYSLKKAEVELLKFIREKGSGSPESYWKILNGIFVPEGDGAVVPSPKTKSRWTLLRPIRVLFSKSEKKK